MFRGANLKQAVFEKLDAVMKPGAILINTARGGLIVDEDLVAAIRGGWIGDVADPRNFLAAFADTYRSAPDTLGPNVRANVEITSPSARHVNR